MTTVYLLVIIAAVVFAIVVVTPAARGWVAALWRRWFKDSEVNLAADVFTVAGLVGELVADPEVSQLFTEAGISPRALLIIGIVVRVLRMSRDRKMVPLTREE